MSGFELPSNMILKIELEHIKTSVRTMLQNRSNEMQQMVTESLERTINEDWVQDSINQAVKSVVRDAIDDVTKNYKLKQAIAELIDDAVVKMVKIPRLNEQSNNSLTRKHPTTAKNAEVAQEQTNKQ